jgi:hypothetical protein
MRVVHIVMMVVCVFGFWVVIVFLSFSVGGVVPSTKEQCRTSTSHPRIAGGEKRDARVAPTPGRIRGCDVEPKIFGQSHALLGDVARSTRYEGPYLGYVA